MDALHATMDVLDDHKIDLGSGGYHLLSMKLKNVHDAIKIDRRRAEWTMALRLLVEAPEAANTMLLRHLVADESFATAMVRYKARDVARFDPKQAALVSELWSRTLVESMLLKESTRSGSTLVEMRLGLKTLLMTKGNMLRKIVRRLNALGVTPADLIPHDVRPLSSIRGDRGGGPRALELLAHEPRMLRWFVGVDETAPWPQVDSCTQLWKKRLIHAANAFGGERSLRGRPCRCRACSNRLLKYFDREYECDTRLTCCDCTERQDEEGDESDTSTYASEVED